MSSVQTNFYEDNELLNRVIKYYYFPFLLKFHKIILVGWIGIFAVCLAFGPAFLSSTKSNLDLPKGTSSELAIQAFTENYPNTSSWPPAFIVAHSDHSNVLNSLTSQMSLNLQAYASSKSSISSVLGYYEYLQIPELRSLADTTVSASNHTMLTTIYFNYHATLTEIQEIVPDLIAFSERESGPDVEFYCTGLFPLFEEMTASTEENFVMIDATVLPIALLILGLSLQSSRHIPIALVNIICMLLLAFSILLPITKTIDINPFSPTIMLSLGIAISFDYSLFMLTRFKEQYLLGSSKNEAVLSSLITAGHVIVVSGATLFCTFLLLLCLPQNFLQSIGFSCSAAVFSAVVTNISITPSLLLAFDFFTQFDICPCLPPSWSSRLLLSMDQHASQGFIPVSHAKVQLNGSSPSPGPAEVDGPPDAELESNAQQDIIASDSPTIQPTQERSLTSRPQPKKLSIWFYCAYYVTKFPWMVLLISIGVTIPFIITFLDMKTTSDVNLVYLRGSRSLKGQNIMKSDFPVGKMDPYQIVVTTDRPGSIFTFEYFQSESALVGSILSTQSPNYIDRYSITSLTYFQGTNLTFDIFRAYLNSTDPLYNSPIATAYRTLALPLVNPAASATLITLVTLIDPNSQPIVPFINDVRNILTKFSNNPPLSTFPLQLFLFGAYTTTLDVQLLVNGFIPIMVPSTIAVVLLIVGVCFGSLALVFRLAITTFMSLAWTFGFLVLVYQPGAPQRSFEVLTPYLRTSTGIYWIIPIMSFSILLGLALDYDIFLISRVVEYRRLGWSDKASCVLAVEKTGQIITAAGIIMSVSFAGLLLPPTTVLNQYGFALFIGVAIDTFLIRPILVPAVISALSINESLNWWPTKMPPVLLKPEEESKLLLAGYDFPDLSLLSDLETDADCDAENQLEGDPGPIGDPKELGIEMYSNLNTLKEQDENINFNIEPSNKLVSSTIVCCVTQL